MTPGPSAIDRAVVDVLVVASWYPGIDDPIAGRFVADLVDALVAGGRARPAVVSFELAALVGSGPTRDKLAELTSSLAATAVRNAADVFAPQGHGLPAGVPVARLTIPSGRHPAAGAAHAGTARQRALTVLADRWLDMVGSAALGVPRPSLVHAHTGYPDGAAAADLALRLHCPLIITEHASFIATQLAVPEIAKRYRATMAQAARVVVVSRTLAAELVDQVPEIKTKVVVIPNAVDVDSFRAAPPPGERRRELLFVGYRKASKGIEVLLRAMPGIRQRHPDITLRLVGRSPDEATEASWHRMASELGVADAVVFDGPTDRAGVAEALQRAALFVHPSPRETFGVVAAEALAAGIPVVAADSGGVTEILGDDPDALGAVVPADDPERLADAVARTLDRLESFDPAALRASVTARFGAAAVGSRIADLYDEVLAEAGAAVAARQPEGDLEQPVPRPEAARILVAFDPDRAKLIATLSEATRSELVVVTSGPGPIVHGVAAVIESDLHGLVRTMADVGALGPPVRGVRRILRAIRHPLAVARRRGLLPGLDRLISTRGSSAIEEAITRARQIRVGSPVVELVCLDAVDHQAAAALLRRGDARLAPGGLRWLGDRTEPVVSRSGVGPG